MIQFSKVKFYYSASAQPILAIPNWVVAAEEQVFLYGPSGSGKSTLLHLLSGMLTANEGEIHILGQPLHTMSSRARDHFRANHIGQVFQAFNLIPYLNAIENIQLAQYFGGSATKTGLEIEIKKLLTILNVEPAVWQAPAHQLSMGQQQRVAIARALINKPRLLIADEPTSSLDEHNRDAFMQLLMEMAKSHCMTLIFVSHDMSLSRYFNRVESLNAINLEQALPNMDGKVCL